MAIVFYLIGAIIGYHFFDFASQKSSKPFQIASVIFLPAYILAKNIAPQEIHIDNYLTQTIVYTLAAFSLWNIADITMGGMTLINMPVIIILGRYAYRALDDYQRQRKEGKIPAFKAKDIGIKDETDYWN